MTEHDDAPGQPAARRPGAPARLARRGLAQDCPRFSGGRYADEEQEAAREGATTAETYRLPGYGRRR